MKVMALAWVICLIVSLALFIACGNADKKCRDAAEKLEGDALYEEDIQEQQKAYAYLEKNCTINEDGEIVAR